VRMQLRNIINGETALLDVLTGHYVSDHTALIIRVDCGQLHEKKTLLSTRGKLVQTDSPSFLSK